MKAARKTMSEIEDEDENEDEVEAECEMTWANGDRIRDPIPVRTLNIEPRTVEPGTLKRRPKSRKRKGRRKRKIKQVTKGGVLSNCPDGEAG